MTAADAVARGPSVRVLPRLDDANRFFWTSGEDGHLRFLRCAACRHYVHPPSPRLPLLPRRHAGPRGR